jgi:hypothetical protein
VLIGRNAKGAPPTPVDRYRKPDAPGKTVVLHHLQAGVVTAGRLKRRCCDAAADTLEVVLRVLRQDGDAVFIRRPPIEAVHAPQQSFFAGY